MLFLSVSQMKKRRPGRLPTAEEQVLGRGAAGAHARIARSPQQCLFHCDPI